MKKMYLILLLACMASLPSAFAVMVQVGNLGLTTTSTLTTPYKTFWHDGRSQYLILASEIIGNGGSAGPINSLAFNVSAAQGAPLNGFTIKIGATALSALTGTFQPNGGFTTCYSATVPNTTLGWNTYVFSSPFIWNGSDNIIVEVCFDNTSYTNNSGVHYVTTAFNSNTYAYTDGVTGCTMTNNMGVETNRPVMLFDITTGLCIDPPTAGTTVSSANPVCANTNFTLSLVGGTTGTGQTYQWQDSPNGTVWANIPGATSASYLGSITNPTYFRCMVTCGMGTDSSSVLLVNLNNFYNCYCNNSFATSTAYGYIYNVTFNSLNNTSPMSCQSYTDYTGIMPTQVMKNVTYPFQTEILGCSGSNYNHVTKVFIDYNQNGTFTDPGEEVLVLGPGLYGVFSGNITINPLALSGVTGMRVVTVETSNPALVQPCGSYTWGETEDYLIEIMNPPVDDAGIAAIEIPATPTCNLINAQITVTLQNMGSDTLKSATINYWINGAPQTPFNWTGTVNPFSNLPGVVIGTATFTNNDFLAIKTTMPNGNNDTFSPNDSLSMVVVSGLNGTYSIGALGDYVTFAAAVTDLNLRGVCGPVVFEVDNVTFNEQIILGQVMGMSSLNTVTFRGTGSNSMLQFNSTGAADNYVIRFNNGDHYIIDSLTIENTGTSFGYVLEFLTGSDSNLVSNCTLRNDTNTISTSTNMSVIYSPSGVNNQFNTFANNTIHGGSYGMYWYGVSSVNLSKNVLVENNTFKNQYFRALHMYNQENMQVKGNTIASNSAFTGLAYQVYMFACNQGFEISGNTFNWPKTIGTSYAIYSSSNTGTVLKKGLIFNNFISVGDTNNTSSAYGIYLITSIHASVHSNNLFARSNSNLNYGLYISGGGNNEVLNNNIALPKLGSALYYSSAAVVSNSDHNNIYAPLGNVGFYAGTTHILLADWQQNTGLDASSLNVDPLYASYSDLHTCAMDLAGSGVAHPAITEDIDGQLRNPNKPYIGADVFMDLNADLLGANQSKCPQDAVQLQVIADPNETITYLWQPGGLTTPSISANNAGWYYVTVTTGCGSAIDSVEITNDPLPVANFNITTTNQLTAVFADASSNASSWNWNFGDGNSSTQQNPFHIYNQSGTYTVTLIVCNDCGCDTISQTVTVLANSIAENTLDNAVQLYPNPNKGQFTLAVQGVNEAHVSITGLDGKVVYAEKLTATNGINKTIVLEAASGLYLVRITGNEGTVVRKLIIE